MKLTREEIEKIAALARLELAEDEKDAFARQLSSILDYVGKLGEVETADIEPMAHSIPVRNVFASDEVMACEPSVRAAALGEFPDKQGDLLKVKAVFS